MLNSGTVTPLAQLFAKRPRFPEVCAYLLLLVTGLIVHGNTLHNSFNYDDIPVILENPAVQHFSAFTKEYVRVNGRAVTDFTFALNHYVHGFSVTGYHLVNLAIHLLSGCLVFSLITTTFRTPWFAGATASGADAAMLSRRGAIIGFFTALFFIVHPVQTQAVTYIAQRSTSLATLLYLSTLLLYVRARLLGLQDSPRRHLSPLLYLVAILVGVVALKAKQISFTLPLTLLLYDLLFFPMPLKRRFTVVTLTCLPLAGAAGFLFSRGMLTMEILDRATRENLLLSRWEYFCTQCRVIVTYLRLLLFPVNQHLDYDYPVYRSFFSLPVVLSFLLLLGLLLGSFVLIRRSVQSDRSAIQVVCFRLAGFGILWFFLTLSVESSFIPISDVIVEHRLYLPAVGALLAMVALLVAIAATPSAFGRRGTLVLGGMVVVAVLLAAASHQRNRVWATDATLWEDEVAKSPNLSRPLNNRARVYLQQNEPLKALADLVRANELSPGYQDTWHNICMAFNRIGSYEDRFDCGYRMLDPSGNVPSWNQSQWFPLASNNLGLAYLVLGDHAKAIHHLREAIRLAPDMPAAHFNLGLEFLSMGDRQGALAELQRVAELNPALARKMVLWFSAGGGGGR